MSVITTGSALSKHFKKQTVQTVQTSQPENQRYSRILGSSVRPSYKNTIVSTSLLSDGDRNNYDAVNNTDLANRDVEEKDSKMPGSIAKVTSLSAACGLSGGAFTYIFGATCAIPIFAVSGASAITALVMTAFYCAGRTPDDDSSGDCAPDTPDQLGLELIV